MVTVARDYRFDPHIIRAYDVRGVVGQSLHPQDYFLLGHGLASYCLTPGDRVIVGRDGRLSSAEMEAALIQGLCQGGCLVETVGVVPTPLVYDAAFRTQATAGCMVTGSHNPPDHNGLKLMVHGRSFYGEELASLAARVMSLPRPVVLEGGILASRPLVWVDHYIDLLLSRLLGLSDRPEGVRLRVVWDPGYGSTVPVVQRLTARLPGNHWILHNRVDGHFPGHEANPSVAKNLKELQVAVLEHKADFGVAFDGDGDRIGMVLADGRIVWPDHLVAWLALTGGAQDGPLLVDVKTSAILCDYLVDRGVDVRVVATGHAKMKEAMRRHGALLAGELSGHVFFGTPYHGIDDGLYAAMEVLHRWLGNPASLGQMLEDFPRTVDSGEQRWSVPDRDKFALMEALMVDLRLEGVEFDATDGIRCVLSGAWWLLRVSHTEPAMVFRAEAVDEVAFAGLRDRLIPWLTKHWAVFGLPCPW